MSRHDWDLRLRGITCAQQVYNPDFWAWCGYCAHTSHPGFEADFELSI